MVTAGDFRNGVTFEEDGNVMQIVGVSSTLNLVWVQRSSEQKVRNVISGSVVEKDIQSNKAIQQHMLRERIWSILTMTVIFIISWIQRAMSLKPSGKQG